MRNSLNPSYHLIPGLEKFSDDVDIELNIDDMVRDSVDDTKIQEQQENDDKKILNDTFDTLDDIIATDLDHDGDPDILLAKLMRTTRQGTSDYLFMKKSRYFNELNTIDRILRHHSHIGQEGFSDILKNVLSGLVNIFVHLLNLFKTTLVFGWRDFKNGELTDYNNSNRLTMTRLYQSDVYFALTEVEVDTPQGMEGTYLAALSSLQTFLTKVNMTERSAQMKALSSALLEDARKQNPLFMTRLHNTAPLLNTRDVVVAFDNTAKIFTSKKTARQTFGKLFSSQKEFETVCKMCMDGDTYLRAVASVHDNLTATEQNFTNLLQTNYSFEKRDLENLSKIVRSFAECFDMYGVVIQDWIRVDHNLTLVTRTIRSSLDM